jgi:hypothetical protein
MGFYENFSSLPVGSRLTPPGWTNPFGSTLISDGIKPDNVDSHICQTIGPLTNFNNIIPQQNASLFWWFSLTRSNNGDATLGQLLSAQVANNQPAPLCSIRMEADSSVSIYVGNILVGNTGILNFYILQEGFYWCQLNLAMDTDPITGEIHFTSIALAINGATLIDTVLVSTGIFTSQVYPDVYGASFTGPLDGAIFLSEITLDGLTSIPSYPNSTNPFNARVSQGVLETLGFPALNNGRVSQGVIELSQLPSLSLARVSQGVIEIATQGTNPGGNTGWTVREV